MVYAPVPGGFDEWLSMGAPGMEPSELDSYLTGERTLIQRTTRMRVRSRRSCCRIQMSALWRDVTYSEGLATCQHRPWDATARTYRHLVS
jgi:hypothetical protein